MRGSIRKAFTLVELLVVIAIIGILIALLLPAVQAAREAARRTQCLNNLVQIGLALHNYENAYEVFPAGTLDDKGPIRSEPKGRHTSWIAQILPYLEEGNTFRHIDFSRSVYAKKNAPARGVPIATLKCPSDPGVPTGGAAWGGSGPGVYPGEEMPEEQAPPVPPGPSNYAGCHHDAEAPIDKDNHGVFFLNSAVRTRDIADGLSHTLFVGEKRLDADDLGWISGTRSTLRNTGGLNEPPPRGSAPNYSFGIPLDDEAAPALPADPLLVVGGFSGYHPGGFNISLGDGSVRFVSYSMNPKAFAQLGHRADGELIQERF